MKRQSLLIRLFFMSLVFPALLASMAAENLIANGDFEQGFEGWLPFWGREAGAGKAVIDAANRHGQAQAARIEHAGGKDWSLSHRSQLAVKPGDVYEISAWVQLKGGGQASLGVVTRDANNQVVDWDYGGRSFHETKGWVLIKGRFVVPAEVVSLQLRLIGSAAATVWIDEVVLSRQGSLKELRQGGLPEEKSIRNDQLEVTFRAADASFQVTDLRTQKRWEQRAGDLQLITRGLKSSAREIDVRLFDPVSLRELTVTVQLDPAAPEFCVKLESGGEMTEPLAWPAPFAAASGQLLILPLNEGISYPVDDPALPPMYYHLYGGHGLCMPWYGVTEAAAGWMAIVETADDAAVRIPRKNRLLALQPEWQAQKKQFGAPRVIRYAFFDRGGYVAMAKRYREHAIQTGLFKTLREKKKRIPSVDLLVGAVNVWCWDNQAPEICREMQALGIKRILWSNARPPDQLKALNDLGVLTSRYDIYQDAMNPENFPQLKWLHSDWTSDAWKNDDLMIGADGEWVRGWEVETKAGGMIPCGTLCDKQATAYAQRRIPAELATHPYHSRFIDTTTASPWRECYHPKHPMTRTESKKSKMELLNYISEGCGLVCGSETGHDAAVPYVHYFEGMLSLGPFRVPDAGRDMQRVVTEVPEPVAKFQTGHVYRLPLWELVYHDCVVAQWYWGDYNNKLPSLWDRRDLWNALYGTPPMFMFNRKSWEANKDRFVKSYQVATPVARATGYSPMISHEWLTTDHAVQQTRFANGVAVTVNFGDKPFKLATGVVLPPLGLHTEGLPAEK